MYLVIIFSLQLLIPSGFHLMRSSQILLSFLTMRQIKTKSSCVIKWKTYTLFKICESVDFSCQPRIDFSLRAMRAVLSRSMHHVCIVRARTIMTVGLLHVALCFRFNIGSVASRLDFRVFPGLTLPALTRPWISANAYRAPCAWLQWFICNREQERGQVGVK